MGRGCLYFNVFLVKEELGYRGSRAGSDTPPRCWSAMAASWRMSQVAGWIVRSRKKERAGVEYVGQGVEIQPGPGPRHGEEENECFRWFSLGKCSLAPWPVLNR